MKPSHLLLLAAGLAVPFPSLAAERLVDAPPPQPFRVWRGELWTSPSWRSRGSPDRLTESGRWDHDTLFPKHNLAAGIAVAEVYGTMSSFDYSLFLTRQFRGAPFLFAAKGDENLPIRLSQSDAGILVLGASETPLTMDDSFEAVPLERTVVYRRRARGQ